jgi:hypothetical protein
LPIVSVFPGIVYEVMPKGNRNNVVPGLSNTTPPIDE